jgi:hypothetical protein
VLSTELARLFDQHAEARQALDGHVADLRRRGDEEPAGSPEAERAAHRAWLDRYMELRQAEEEANALLAGWQRRMLG